MFFSPTPFPPLDRLQAHYFCRPSFGVTPADLLDAGHLWNRPQDGQHPLPTVFPDLRYSVHGHMQMLRPVVDLEKAGMVYIDMGVSKPEGFCVWNAEERKVIFGDE